MKKTPKNGSWKLNKKYAATITVLVVIIALSLPVVRSSVFEALSAIYGSVLVALANKDRLSQDISELKTNPVLEAAAQLKANDMAKKGYFSHNTPDGKTPWYWFEQAGYRYTYAGENLAVNFLNSEDVHDAWIRSELHKANILNRNYTEIGIATSTGVYKGKEAIFIVQLFGKPQK